MTQLQASRRGRRRGQGGGLTEWCWRLSLHKGWACGGQHARGPGPLLLPPLLLLLNARCGRRQLPVLLVRRCGCLLRRQGLDAAGSQVECRIPGKSPHKAHTAHWGGAARACRVGAGYGGQRGRPLVASPGVQAGCLSRQSVGGRPGTHRSCSAAAGTRRELPAGPPGAGSAAAAGCCVRTASCRHS